MKNRFLIFNFQVNIAYWKLKNFYHFPISNIELKIEMCKNVLLHFNFKLKIEWHFRCTDYFALKISSLFGVILDQKIVNLLFLYFQFGNGNYKIELIFYFRFNNANQKLNWIPIFWVKLKLEIVFLMQSRILQLRTKLGPKTKVTLLKSSLSQLSAPRQHHPPTDN